MELEPLLDNAHASGDFCFLIHPATEEYPLSIESGPRYFEDDCVFDLLADEQAAQVLTRYVQNGYYVGWELLLELSKLLSKRGRLIADLIESWFAESAMSFAPQEQLFFSYPPLHPQGEQWALRLLDVVGEDMRDGLLLGCLKLRRSGWTGR